VDLLGARLLERTLSLVVTGTGRQAPPTVATENGHAEVIGAAREFGIFGGRETAQPPDMYALARFTQK
jgi:hypothetical protein